MMNNIVSLLLQSKRNGDIMQGKEVKTKKYNDELQDRLDLLEDESMYPCKNITLIFMCKEAVSYI